MEDIEDIIYEYERSNMTTDELIFKLTSYLLSRIEEIEERMDGDVLCQKKNK
jgi:hypothetical protein